MRPAFPALVEILRITQNTLGMVRATVDNYYCWLLAYYLFSHGYNNVGSFPNEKTDVLTLLGASTLPTFISQLSFQCGCVSLACETPVVWRDAPLFHYNILGNNNSTWYLWASFRGCRSSTNPQLLGASSIRSHCASGFLQGGCCGLYGLTVVTFPYLHWTWTLG